MTRPPEGSSGCLPELTYAIYVDGELSPEELRPVEAHLVTCRRCRELVVALREEAALLTGALQERTPARRTAPQAPAAARGRWSQTSRSCPGWARRLSVSCSGSRYWGAFQAVSAPSHAAKTPPNRPLRAQTGRDRNRPTAWRPGSRGRARGRRRFPEAAQRRSGSRRDGRAIHPTRRAAAPRRCHRRPASC